VSTEEAEGVEDITGIGMGGANGGFEEDLVEREDG
jgi:hypothetical protein